MDILHPRDPGTYEGRLCPAKREGDKIFVRTASIYETELIASEPVKINAGDSLEVAQGDLILDSAEIDLFFTYGITSKGSYAPVAPTIAGCGIEGPDPKGRVTLIAAARKVDLAHSLWAESTDALEMSRKEKSPKAMAIAYDSLGKAEGAIISLSNGINILQDLNSEGFTKKPLPDNVRRTMDTIHSMRGSFEHIKPRIDGMVSRRKKDPETAHTILHQDRFVSSGIIVYSDKCLDFERGFLGVLRSCRAHLMALLEESFGENPVVSISINGRARRIQLNRIEGRNDGDEPQ